MANLSTSGPVQLAKGGALDVDSVKKVDCAADDTPNKLTVRAVIGDLREGETGCSEMINIGGLDWFMHVNKMVHSPGFNPPQFFTVTILCNNYATTWSARLKVHLKLTFPDGRTIEREAEDTINHEKNLYDKMAWEDFEATLTESDKDGELVVEATFVVVDVTGLRKSLDAFDHTMASARHDCILVIEGRKVHVGKQILAFHSAHFDTLFFGETAMGGKHEYALDGVSHTDFMRLLAHLRTPTDGVLNEETVEPMLRLATKFDFQGVVKQCETLLISSEVMLPSAKFVLADKFSLTAVEDACIWELDTAEKAREVLVWGGCEAVSDRLKYAIAMRGLFAEVEDEPEQWSREEEEEEGDEDAATTA